MEIPLLVDGNTRVGGLLSLDELSDNAWALAEESAPVALALPVAGRIPKHKEIDVGG